MRVFAAAVLCLFANLALLPAQTIKIRGHAGTSSSKPTLCDCPEGTPATLELELNKFFGTTITVINKHELVYPVVVGGVFSGHDPLEFQSNKATLRIGNQTWVSEFGATEGGVINFINFSASPGTYNAIDTTGIIVSEYTQERMAYLGIDIRTNPSAPLWNTTGAALTPQLTGTPKLVLASPHGERVIFLVDSIEAKASAAAATSMKPQMGSPSQQPSTGLLGNPSKFEELETEESPALLRQAFAAAARITTRAALSLGIEMLAVLSLSGDTPQTPETAQKLDESLKKGCRASGAPYTVTFPFDKVPAIASHIAVAQTTNDQWRVLTKSSSSEKVKTARRNAACKETRKYIASRGQNGILSCDEYPFASSREGGVGASGWAVPLAEQYMQGYILMRFYTGFDDGIVKPDETRFCVETIE